MSNFTLQFNPKVVPPTQFQEVFAFQLYSSKLSVNVQRKSLVIMENAFYVYLLLSILHFMKENTSIIHMLPEPALFIQ